MSSEPNLDILIEKIVSYKGGLEHRLIDKFNKESLLKLLEDHDQITIIENKFKEFTSEGLDIYGFIRAILQIITHNYDETLYLTIALVDLFRDICESFDLKHRVKTKDVVSYVSDVSKLIKLSVYCNRIYSIETLPLIK